MADWCLDEYRVMCGDKAVLDDIRSLFERNVAEGSEDGRSVPLGRLMDEFGFDGDRSGLTVGSFVNNFVVGDGYVSFSVHNNFSYFDPVRSMVDHYGKNMRVTARFQTDESGFRCDSGWIDCPARQEEKAGEALDFEKEKEWFLGLDRSRQWNILELSYTMNSVSPYARYMVQDFVMRHAGNNYGHEDFTREDLADIFESFDDDDLKVLRGLNGRLEENDPALTGYETMPVDYTRAKDVPDFGGGVEPDIQDECEKMLKVLYGSSSARQRVSPFMRGFDLAYAGGRVCVLSQEDALKRAEEYGLNAEVREEFEHGATVREALREWDLDDPEKDYVSREQLDFLYDGDVMLSFKRDAGERFWSELFRDGALVDLFEDRTGFTLSDRLVPVAGTEGVGFSSRLLLDVAKEAVSSPENKNEVRQAVDRCRRRTKQREMLSRLGTAPSGSGLKK